MSDTIFSDLGLPEPDAYLGVGSRSHAEQTAGVMMAFEPVLREARPDWVVLVGDVNSTLACALVATKLREETGCRITHVEAGLRSRNWRMPEETNRVLTDRLSDLLFTPSRNADANLIAEGIEEEKIRFIGNVMIDTPLERLSHVRGLDLPGRLGLTRGGYAAATLHRPANVDDPASLRTVLEGLALIADEMPVVLPLHPRTRKNAEAFDLMPLLEPLMAMEPVGYDEMLSLMEEASVVLTDSGGIQEETTILGVPCVTLRKQTERPITLTEGTNHMVPWPITTKGLISTYRTALENGAAEGTGKKPEFWDGHAAERIVDELMRG